MITATSIVTQIRNAHPRANGYAPNQKLLLHFSGKVLVRSAHVHDRRHFDLFVASWLWNFGLLKLKALRPPHLVFQDLVS